MISDVEEDFLGKILYLFLMWSPERREMKLYTKRHPQMNRHGNGYWLSEGNWQDNLVRGVRESKAN